MKSASQTIDKGLLYMASGQSGVIAHGKRSYWRFYWGL